DGLDGYDTLVARDGQLVERADRGGRDGAGDVVLVRVDPNDSTVVEFAVDYPALGLSAASFRGTLYWDFEAVQGGPKNPKEYRWNDSQTATDAGSPNPGRDGLSEFGTPGLGTIYELDTLRDISVNLCGVEAPAGEVGFTALSSLVPYA